MDTPYIRIRTIFYRTLSAYAADHGHTISREEVLGVAVQAAISNPQERDLYLDELEEQGLIQKIDDGIRIL